MSFSLLLSKAKQLLSLQPDQASPQVLHARIEAGATLSGTNTYILALAILIASIGLNMNSTAVVIGAMLISPLMGVLFAIAYAISGYDLPVLRRNLKKLLFQVLVSIVTSFLYFQLSPMDSFSGELAARTHPTTWDVLVAFFGGAAAVIANTRRSTVSNVIPGAAIATALMPPLCTVGYCLANGKGRAALGAGYLFFLNAVFITLAAILGLRLMKLAPARAPIALGKKWLLVVCLGLVLVLPSGFLALERVRQNSVQEHYQTFLTEEMQFDDAQIVKSSLDQETQVLHVALIGALLDEDTLADLQARLARYELGAYTLEVTQVSVEQGVTQQELEALLARQEAEAPGQADPSAQQLLALQASAAAEKDQAIRELLSLYPEVSSAGFASLRAQDQDEPVFSLVLSARPPLGQEDLSRLQRWLDSKDLPVEQILQVTAPVVGE